MFNKKKEIAVQRHKTIVEKINRMLSSEGFELKCEFVKDKGFNYLIQNPNESGDNICIEIDKKNNAILYFSITHIHIDYFGEADDERAKQFYECIKEIVTDETIAFQIAFPNGCPCMGGSHNIKDIQDILDIFNNDEHVKDCNKLIIRSWSGKHNKDIIK